MYIYVACCGSIRAPSAALALFDPSVNKPKGEVSFLQTQSAEQSFNSFGSPPGFLRPTRREDLGSKDAALSAWISIDATIL